MNIKKYSVTVTKTHNVDVIVDLDKINEQFLEEFSGYMWEVDCVEDVVKHIATCTAFGDDPEGVGCLKTYKQTEEEALAQNGFVSEVDYEETEAEID